MVKYSVILHFSNLRGQLMVQMIFHILGCLILKELGREKYI